MVVVTRVVALVLRLCFFALSTWGLVGLIRGKDDQGALHLRIIGAILCLFLSCALVGRRPAELLMLLLCFVALVACDLFFARKGDKANELFLPVALLSAIGVAISFDVMGPSATSHIVRTCLFCGVCVATMVIARKHSHWLAASFPVFLAATVILCALPLVPGIGIAVNGSRAWVGIMGRTLGQPSEFAKVTLAIALAGYLSANVDRLSTFNMRGILPLLFIFALALGTELLVRDIGTAMVLLAAAAAMVMISSRKAGAIYGAIAMVGLSVLLVFAYHNFSHVAQRFDAWRSPEGTYSGEHLLKAAATMANGGLIGTGLGLGHSFHTENVFAIDTDSIYAAIVEELGLLGGAQVLLAIVALAVVAGRIARQLPKESFERNLLNTGAVLICVQAFIIIAGITRVIPLTGVTLPFISRGGSSLLSCFLLMGMMGAAASSEKYDETGISVSSLAVPVLCSVGFAACLAMTAHIVVSKGGVRLCGVTEHYDVGNVETSDGVVLAKGSFDENHAITFEYPQGTMAAHVIGAYSNGITARLKTDDYLRKASNPLFNLFGIPETICQMTLTIDWKAQTVAEEQLRENPGAIVAYDARTGAILAEASSPTYDPSRPGYNVDTSDTWAFNRAIHSHYAPGSTFKIVTAAAALESGYATPDTVLTGDCFELPGGEPINNIGEADLGEITLAEALFYSSNTAFADLALQMGDGVLLERAEAFGFNETPDDYMLQTIKSTYGPTQSDFSLALASFGQPTNVGGVPCGPEVSVLKMAEVMGAVYNKGVRMTPYIVQEGRVAKGPMRGASAMGGAQAQQLWDMLVGSSHVEGARVEVAGKTGTAETAGTNVCWYVCAADGIVVSCCVEGTNDLGGEVAMPRALAVLDSIVDLGISTE